MFRSVWDRIHSVYTGQVLNWKGKVPHRITFISGSIWYQIADPIRTGSTRSRVNTRLIRTNSKRIWSRVNTALISEYSLFRPYHKSVYLFCFAFVPSTIFPISQIVASVKYAVSFSLSRTTMSGLFVPSSGHVSSNCWTIFWL